MTPNPLDLLDQIILQVITLKGPKLMLVCLIGIGYALKAIPWVDNKRIPLINMVCGPLLAPFFISWPNSGDMEPGLRYPEIAAYFQVCAMGFLMAGGAWLVHAQVLKRLIDSKFISEESPPKSTIDFDEAARITNPAPPVSVGQPPPPPATPTV